MRLSARPLENVININSWNYSDTAYVMEGQANTIYLQLIDLSKEVKDGCNIRYLSQSTSIGLTIYFDSIDNSQQFEIIGTQPFADDKSIWQFNIPSDKLPKTGSVKIKITEDGIDRYFVVKSFVEAELLGIGGC